MARKRVIDIRDPELTDEAWERLAPLLPEPEASPDGGPKPIPNRPVVEGILWVLRNGGRWKALPQGYPSPATCWRRLAEWEERGVWLDAWRTFLDERNAEGRIRWEECFADGSFASAKKGGDGVGKTKKGKGTKWMVVVDGEGLPLAFHLDSANRAEVKLLETTLDNIEVTEAEQDGTPPQPERLILDRGYDSDPLRERLAARGIEMICPHRKNRVKPRTQDGRKLRRYRRRWKVERTFAWLGNFRRLVVRYERRLDIYRAFFHVACLIITLRQL